MNKEEIDKILNDLGKNITNITKKSYDEFIRMIRDGISPQDAQKRIKDALSTINEKAAIAIASSLSDVLQNSISAEMVKDFKVDGMKLSTRMYHNSKDVSVKSMRVINEAIKQNKTINEISKLLYEGYNFKDDPLHVKQKGTIPKWLKKELDKPPSQRSFKQVSTIKTKALKTAYSEALRAKSYRELSKRLKSAFYEKSRYYANRIAQNEVMKAYSISRAKLLADDDNVEVVRVMMSRTHKRVDICDYHSGVDKYGLGKGVYPKDKAPISPFHQFCRCVTVPLYSKSAKGAKLNKKADKKLLDKFTNYEKSLILGSNRRRDMFLKSGDVLKSAYLGNPMYINGAKSQKYIGYNVGMKNYKENLEKFISDIENGSIKKNEAIVGFVDNDVVYFLKEKGVLLKNRDIVLTVKSYNHSTRDFKKSINKSVDSAIIKKLDIYLKNPEYIYYDNLSKHKNLVYVGTSNNQLFKIIIDLKTYIVTLGKINKDNLKDKFLEKIR